MLRKHRQPPLVKIKNKYAFERVDIFLRVKGRLPTQKDDCLTQEILDEYCKRYEIGDLTEGIVPLEYMYQLIKNDQITAFRKVEG